MSDRRRRKRRDSGSSSGSRILLAHLPVEVHRTWLECLSQPELLRVRAVSRSWRAVVLDQPQFYLAVRIEAIREYHDFLQRLSHAVLYKLPTGVVIDMPFRLGERDRDVLANHVSPAIERAMPYLRKLTITTDVPLPARALRFLDAPAPQLRELLHVCNHDDGGSTDDYESASSSNFPGAAFRASRFPNRKSKKPSFRDPPPYISSRLFGNSAPKLKHVVLEGVTLPTQPLAAFSGVGHVSLRRLMPFPRGGLGAHFPSAKFLEITELDDDFAKGKAGARSMLLPGGLRTVALNTSMSKLQKIMQIADTKAIPHLRVCVDSHYGPDGPTRGAVWAQCLANLVSPRRLSIFTTMLRPITKRASDLHILVLDGNGARSVTFCSADDDFAYEQNGDTEYTILSSLAPLTASLVELSVDHAHLIAIFSIAKGLPTLSTLRIILPETLSAPFWVRDHRCRDRGILRCPALEQLVLSCDGPEEGIRIRSKELAQFGRAIGLPRSRPPALVAKGVRVKTRKRLTALFSM